MAEYARAQVIERRLQVRPISQRTRADYERALDAYRAVYHGDPASPDAARSVAAVADLLASEGGCFHDARMLREAVAQWKFLRSQYPGSPLRQRASVQIAEIEQDNPHGGRENKPHLAVRAQANLHTPHPAEMQHRTDAAPAAPLATSPTPAGISADQDSLRSPNLSRPVASAEKKNPTAESVRYWTPHTLPTNVNLATLESVRFWTVGRSTRFAVDMSGPAAYRIYPAADGRQITVIFFGTRPAASLLEHAIPMQRDRNVRTARIGVLTGNQTELILQLVRPGKFSSFTLPNPQRLIVDVGGIGDGGTQPTAVLPLEKDKARDVVQSVLSESKDAAADRQPAADSIAEGQRSMTRVLGLRVRRIVIDAGHGGHDSGTLGPGGLQEKDVALDVALRLGHLLQQRIGADVIYTRRTDTFVPLEQRTAIANRAHADLFISIHANSSPDPNARGVETYFLNFTASPAALAVAARENAVSNRSEYELSDLVRSITLSDKIDESREFAGDVQQSLYSELAVGNAGVKNRGVKQAPFVVLIGAHMPSILAEISFLTNPTDANELARPSYRERLAEALYRGVVDYVDGMSGVRVAKTGQPKMMTGSAE